MLIAAISSSSNPVRLNPALTLRPRIAELPPLAALASGSSSAAAPSPASASNAGASSSTPQSGGTPAHGAGGWGGGESAAATAATGVETLVDAYSITVGGTQYAGNVEEENGSYVASVPNVSGATATGATLIEAENNLTIRIDELV